MGQRKSSASAKAMPMVGMDAPGKNTRRAKLPAGFKGSKVSGSRGGRSSGGQTTANGTKMGVMKPPV